MVAEVSTLIRLMNGSGVRSNESSSSKSTALITRDLLGGCCSSTIDSKELDLDSQVPSGWEKRLDLKSGKVYLERSNYSTLVHNKQHTSCNNQLSLSEEDTKLELKLLPSSSPISSSGNYHSVCTLEKVKSALERAEKELSTRNKRKSSISSSSSTIMSMSMSSSSSSNYSNSSIEDMSSSNNSFAAGCPSCLIYVLISKTNPRCPRCNTTIVPILPHHVGMKKPRFDLNISI